MHYVGNILPSTVPSQNLDLSVFLHSRLSNPSNQTKTMKLSIVVSLMIGAPLAVGAFTVVVPVSNHHRSVVSLNAEVRPDTSELIKEAMAAAKQFGATSAEARLAWETVEEMDSSTRTRYVVPL